MDMTSTEVAAQYLAAVVSGELLNLLDYLRHECRRQMAAAESPQFCRIELLALVVDDYCFDDPTPRRICNPHDSGIAHCRVPVENVLNLGRINLFS